MIRERIKRERERERELYKQGYFTFISKFLDIYGIAESDAKFSYNNGIVDVIIHV